MNVEEVHIPSQNSTRCDVLRGWMHDCGIIRVITRCANGCPAVPESVGAHLNRPAGGAYEAQGWPSLWCVSNAASEANRG